MAVSINSYKVKDLSSATSIISDFMLSITVGDAVLRCLKVVRESWIKAYSEAEVSLLHFGL